MTKTVAILSAAAMIATLAALTAAEAKNNPSHTAEMYKVVRGEDVVRAPDATAAIPEKPCAKVGRNLCR